MHIYLMFHVYIYTEKPCNQETALPAVMASSADSPFLNAAARALWYALLLRLAFALAAALVADTLVAATSASPALALGVTWFDAAGATAVLESSSGAAGVTAVVADWVGAAGVIASVVTSVDAAGVLASTWLLVAVFSPKSYSEMGAWVHRPQNRCRMPIWVPPVKIVTRHLSWIRSNWNGLKAIAIHFWDLGAMTVEELSQLLRPQGVAGRLPPFKVEGVHSSFDACDGVTVFQPFPEGGLQRRYNLRRGALFLRASLFGSLALNSTSVPGVVGAAGRTKRSVCVEPAWDEHKIKRV